MTLVPATELSSRRARVQARMAAAGVDALLVLQNADVYWLAGTLQQGALWLPVDGEPVFAVRKDLGRARRESALAGIVPMRSPRDLPAAVAAAGLPAARRVGMELDVVPVALFRRWEAVLGGAEVVDASPLLRAVRSVKSDWEVERIRASAVLSDRVFALAGRLVRPGLGDLELGIALEAEARRGGHGGIIRMRAFNAEMVPGHAFSGADAAVPAGFDAPLGGEGLGPAVGQGSGTKAIAAGEAVVVDLLTCVDGYLADQTRTFCAGTLAEPLAGALGDCVAVLERMEAIARPGVAWGAVYDACLALATERGHADRFMGAPGSQVSFIGHGVGVEVDEPPFLARGFKDALLEPGMVFAFEPKVVFPGLGAVGVEDTYLVTAAGVEALTRSPRGE